MANCLFSFQVKQGDPLLSLKEATAAEIKAAEEAAITDSKTAKENEAADAKAAKEAAAAEAKAAKEAAAAEAKAAKEAAAIEARAKKEAEANMTKEEKEAAAAVAKVAKAEAAAEREAAKEATKAKKREFKYLAELSKSGELAAAEADELSSRSSSRRSKSVPRSHVPTPSYLAAAAAQAELDQKIAAAYIPRSTQAPLVKEQWANCPKRSRSREHRHPSHLVLIRFFKTLVLVCIAHVQHWMT
jgi:hypothetical protein